MLFLLKTIKFRGFSFSLFSNIKIRHNDVKSPEVYPQVERKREVIFGGTQHSKAISIYS